jgi:hypothetical protein
MSGPVPGSNWYECEDDAVVSYRWTGPLHETTLDLPLASGRDFEMSLGVIITELGDLTADVNGTELPIRCRSAAGREHKIAIRIPAAVVSGNGLTTVRFQTKDVFQASDADIRPLSFLVCQLSISEVGPARLTTARAAASSVGATDTLGE